MKRMISKLVVSGEHQACTISLHDGPPQNDDAGGLRQEMGRGDVPEAGAEPQDAGPVLLHHVSGRCSKE